MENFEKIPNSGVISYEKTVDHKKFLIKTKLNKKLISETSSISSYYFLNMFPFFSNSLDFRRGWFGEMNMVLFFILEVLDYETTLLITLYLSVFAYINIRARIKKFKFYS